MDTLSPVAGPKLARAHEAVGPKASLAIWYWAAIGAFFVLWESWIFGNWFAYDFHPTNPGPSYVPEWMRIAVRGNDIFWAVAIAVTAYYAVIRPKIKTGQFSFTGLFCMAFIFAWWQDCLFSYNSMGFSYSSLTWNMGSWGCHIPGWRSPGGCHLSEPLTWDFSFYFVLTALGAIFASWVMHQVKAKNPAIRVEVLFLGLYVLAGIADFILEFAWVAMGVYHYGGVANDMAIFTNSRLKFPMWEPVAIGWYMCCFTAIVFYRDDKGETWAERGLSHVRLGAGSKTFLRYLALVGILNVVFLVGYSIPAMLLQTQASAWPAQTQSLSYFTNGICGEGTAYACGGGRHPDAV